jgi:hypothetical protein
MKTKANDFGFAFILLILLILSKNVFGFFVPRPQFRVLCLLSVRLWHKAAAAPHIPCAN